MGPLWLRSICLGVTDLHQAASGLLWPRSDSLGVPLTRSVRLGVLAAQVAWLRMDGRKPRSWHSQACRRAMGETSGAAALLLGKEQEGPEPQRDSRSCDSLSGNLSGSGRPWLRPSGTDSAQAE